MTLDLRGQPFGKWLALYKGSQTAHGQFWVCQCACNPAVTVELIEAALVDGWTRSCGCDYVRSDGQRQPRRDWTGRQFGQRLVVRFYPGGTERWRSIYLCRCVCGEERLITHVRKRMRCVSCTRRKPLAVRWYGEVFVEGVVGKDKDGRPLYQARSADGSAHIVRGSTIRRGRLKGVGKHRNWGTVGTRVDQVMAWLSSGVSKGEISRRLGVGPRT
jgi:hypothetical protein